MCSHYWTHTKFANWLRGTPSPRSATCEAWGSWRAEAKAAHPVRYWLVETGIDKIDDWVHWLPGKLRDFRYYCLNRWRLSNYVHTGLPHGYYDCDILILHGLYQTVVDYVEQELAWMEVVFAKAEKRKYGCPRWFTGRWRSREAGLAHLAWAKALTHDMLDDDDPDRHETTRQAEAAAEIEAVYLYVKDERPKLEAAVEAALSDWYDNRPKRRAGEDVLDKARFKLHTILEQELDAKDTEMLCRIVKVRQSMWT